MILVRLRKRRAFLLASFTVLLLGSFQNCSNGFKATSFSSTIKESIAGDAYAKTCGDYAPGRTTIHRLTNNEYNNTVHDLLFTSKRPADSFPPEVAGGSGYTNDSNALAVSDVLVEGYFNAANTLASEVISSKGVANGAYSKIAPCGATVSSSTMAACVQQTVRGFASKAFRRPVTDDEVNQLSNFFTQASSFDDGLSTLISAVLISPKFLFVNLMGPYSRVNGAVFALDDYAVASRLSYFLWQTMPDDTLMQAAAAGQLSDPEQLAAQARRMSKDARSIAFTRVLRDEWLGLKKINSPISNLDENLRQSMITETDMLLNDIVTSDQPFTNLFKADYTYANKLLADYYGLPYTGANPAQFIKISYGSSPRLGVLSHASFLSAQGGMAVEVSAVKRGHALASSVFCTPFGPPPPGALPSLSDDPSLVGNPRQKLIQATNSVACLGCHTTMNNLGFGLNIYSPFGQYRTVYNTSSDAIDSSGAVSGVISFADGMDMLRQIPNLSSVKSCFPQQVMAIATSRDVRSSDDTCIQNLIGAATSASNSKFSDLITQVVLSREFRMQTGEAP